MFPVTNYEVVSEYFTCSFQWPGNMLTSELLNCICRFGRRKKTISLRQTVWLRQLASSESHTCRRWVKQGSEVTTRPKRFLRRFQLRRQNSDRFWRRFPTLSPSVLLVSLVIRVTNVTIMITMVINRTITMLIMTKIPIWKRALYSSNYARPDCCQWICYLNFVQPQPPNQLFRAQVQLGQSIQSRLTSLYFLGVDQSEGTSNSTFCWCKYCSVFIWKQN